MFSKLCIRKPVTTIMVTLMVFIAGIVSYFNLDQALMPDMDLPIAVVMTTYVGASPEEIEELISKPMEESLGSIANVDTVTSYSSTNSSMVLLQFVDGTDIDMATVMVQNRVSIAQSSLPEPVIVQGITTRKQSSNIVMMLTLSSKDSIYDGLYLSNYATLNMIDQLTRLPGVGSVQVMGA